MKQYLTKSNLKRVMALLLMMVMLVGIVPTEAYAGSKSNQIADDVKVYDLYDITGALSKTIASETTLGTLQKSNNVGWKMKVDLSKAEKKEMLIGLANDTTNFWTSSGYAVDINTNTGKICIFAKTVNDTTTGKVNVASSAPIANLTNNPFDLEIGVADLRESAGGEVVGRRVYVKKDGQEVVSYVDERTDHVLGQNICLLYAKGLMLTSIDYALREATVYDIYKVIGNSSVTVSSSVLGTLPEASNVGWKLKLDLSTSGGERLIGLGNDTNNFWDSTGYAIDVNCNTGKIAIFAQVDNAAAGKENVVSAACSGLKSEFVLEGGVVDLYRKDTNQVVARKVYAKKDGEEIVSYIDKDIQLVLGNNICLYNMNGITVESVNYSNEGPSDTLSSANVTSVDFYDITGELTRKIAPGISNIGKMSSLNYAFKTKVDLVKSVDNNGQFIITLGSTSDKSATPVDGSGYQVWFQPTDGKVILQHCVPATTPDATQGKSKQVAWNNSIAIPSSFDFEFGTRQILFSNNDVYGVEVYVKIDGNEILNWIDLNENRILGQYIMCYATSQISLTLSSNYEMTRETVTKKDIYDLQKETVITVTSGNYGLGQMSTTNTALRTKVQLKNVNGESSHFLLSVGSTKENVAGPVDGSSYQFWFIPAENRIVIQHGEKNDADGAVSGKTKQVASRNYTIPSSFILEVGTREVNFKNNNYGKEVYLMIDDVEVISWIDQEVDTKVLGDYVVCYCTKMEVNFTSLSGRYLVREDVKVNDLYDTSREISITATSGANTSLGVMKTENNAFKAEVSFAKTNNEEEQFLVSIGSTSETVAGPVDGSSYQFWFIPALNRITIQHGVANTKEGATSGKTNAVMTVSYEIPEKFELEVGTREATYDNGDPYGREVYLKIDGQEVASWRDKEASNRLLGENIVCYCNKMSVDFKSLSGRYLVREDVKVNDLYDTSREILITATSGANTSLGVMKTENNAFKAEVSFAKTNNEEEQFLVSIGSTSETVAGPIDGSSYQFWFIPALNRITIQHGVANTKEGATSGKTNAVMTVNCSISEKFVLEIGTREATYDNGDPYGREVYLKIDGQEVASWRDKEASDRLLGENIVCYCKKMSVDFKSLSGRYLVRENVKVKDLYDTSSEISVVAQKNGNTSLGVMKTKNTAFKAQVSFSKTNNEDEQFLVSIGSTSETVAGPIDGSSYQFWFIPALNRITIQHGVANTKEGANSGKTNAVMTVSYELPEKFELEVGTREAKYDNGDPYGREVYIKIDGQEIASWRDKEASNRLLGENIVCYCKKMSVTFTSLSGRYLVRDNVKMNDFYDITGQKKELMPPGNHYIGQMDVLNSALKMTVDLKKPMDETEQFLLSIGSTSKEVAGPTDGSSYQFWFRPYENILVVQVVEPNTTEGAKTGKTKGVKQVECKIPEHFVLEIGVRSAKYDNGDPYGREVYAKINGVEVVSWRDKGASTRKLGKYVMAYTTSTAEVTYSTSQKTFDVPVTYYINGEKQKSCKFVAVDSAVIPGKPCEITVDIVPNQKYYTVFEKIKFNGETLKTTSTTISSGSYSYNITANSGDSLEVYLSTKELTVDKPSTVLDLFDVTGQRRVATKKASYGPVGTMNNQKGRQVINSALQWCMIIPEKMDRFTIAMYGDQKHVWGATGYLIELKAGKVQILYPRDNRVLAEAECDLIAPGNTIFMESGMVKCYTDGIWTYNRYYVKVGTSLDNMELVCWYDTEERGGEGSHVLTWGMGVDYEMVMQSIKKMYSITDTSTQANQAKLASYEGYKKTLKAIYYPEYTVGYTTSAEKGEKAVIKLYVAKGKKLKKFVVAGVDVTRQVSIAKDGAYCYEIPSVTRNIDFSYVIE